MTPSQRCAGTLVDATPEFISVHRLVQLVVRDRLEPQHYRLFHEIADRLEHGLSDSNAEVVFEEGAGLKGTLSSGKRFSRRFPIYVALLGTSFCVAATAAFVLYGTVVNAPANIGLNEKQAGQQVSDVQNVLERVLAQVARDKAVEITPLRTILGKLGEAGVLEEDIPKRLDD
jgi:hypothetical protein